MLIARAFSGFPTWIKLYINSCNFLKNGPLCGLLTFDRSPNMVRRSACMSASFLENIVNILSDFLPENCEVATAIDEV